MYKSFFIEIDRICKYQLRQHEKFKDYKIGCGYMCDLFENNLIDDDYLTIRFITLKIEEIFGFDENIFPIH